MRYIIVYYFSVSMKYTYNIRIGEQLHTYITAGRALVRVLFLFFFFVSICVFFFVSFLLSLTVLIVCRFFPQTHSHTHTLTIASTKPHVCFSIRCVFFISFYSSFTHSSFHSFFLFVQRTGLIKFTITFEMFNLCVHACVCVYERMKLTRHVCTHNCVTHRRTNTYIFFVLVFVYISGLSFD